MQCQMPNTLCTEDQFIGNMSKVAITYQFIIWKIPMVELSIFWNEHLSFL